MATYQLTIHPTGGSAVTRHIAAEPAGLAQEIHRHVRGLLGGNIAIDLHGLDGVAHRGSARVADFTLEPSTAPAVATNLPSDSGIKWGYTLRELDRMARIQGRTNLTGDRPR
jgi:hypothetical protein